MHDDYLQRIVSKTDGELLEMLLDKAADYRPEALEAARREVERRGLPLERPAPADAAPQRLIACPACGGTRFQESGASAERAADGMFARVLTCTACGRTGWFVAAPAAP